jgi:hypothetical protein
MKFASVRHSFPSGICVSSQISSVESVHFYKDDHYVGFYDLFIL